MKELGIYVHIPFCKEKCYYCDFISFPKKEELMEKYVQALNKEIISKNNVNDYKITTIYIGGGTPSYINEIFIENILNSILKNYNVTENAEITIEVNPGTVNEQKLEKYKEIGINRLSIGLQSANNKLLKNIGRIHTFQDFLSTYELARRVGFKNINVDLMMGLPNQTIKDLEESIEIVIKLNPEHISVYSLILEEQTPFYKMFEENKIKLPTETKERKMYWKTKKILEENNYIHYEISNFAKKDFESKHNLNCWNQKEYLGFGLAAHSYLNQKRFCNTDNLEKYIKNIENNNIDENIEILEKQLLKDTKKEYMLLSLRKIEGVNIKDFKNKFVDNPIFLYHKELEKLVREKLVIIDGNFIRLTKKGLDLANIVWEEFV